MAKLMFDPWGGTWPSDDPPPHWNELSTHVRERIGGACINVLAQHPGPSPAYLQPSVFKVLEDVREDPAVAKAFRHPEIQPGTGLIGECLRRLHTAGDVLESLVARRDALDEVITRLRGDR